MINFDCPLRTASFVLRLACDTVLIVTQEAFYRYPTRYCLLHSPQHSWGIRFFIHLLILLFSLTRKGNLSAFRFQSSPIQDYLIKFVRIRLSSSGSFNPIFSPRFLQLMKNAILFPRVRMVCNPSRSYRTSSGQVPCTMFQYCEVTMGICMRPKYLFIWSQVAVVPALLAEITAAAGFSRRWLPPPFRSA